MRWVLGLVLFGACIRDDLVPCSDGRLCPVGLACDTFHHTCTTPVEADACAGKLDLDSCSSPLSPTGVCLGSVCQPCTPNAAYCVYSGWTPMTSDTTADLYDVWVAGPGDAYVVGSAGTILHYDGTTWAPLAGFPSTTQNLVGIWGTDAATNMVVIANDGTVYRFDGTWTQDKLTQNTAGVWCSAANDIYVVGTSATIAHFDGASWVTTSVGIGPFPPALVSIWGSSKNDIWTVGNGGTQGHYNGTSWSSSIGPTSFYGVGGSSFDNVFVAGGGAPTGNVLSRFDGTSWTAMSFPPAGMPLKSVWAGGAADAFVASADGYVLHYDGVAFSVMATPPAIPLNAIDGIPNGTVYAVGAGGTIWRYSSP